jgi:hypothetical protein
VRERGENKLCFLSGGLAYFQLYCRCCDNPIPA